jgi:hypothetical protein
MRRFFSVSSYRLAGAALALVLASAAAPLVRADEFVDRANALLGTVPEARRSDLVVLPVFAKMDPAPAAFKGNENAVLYDATSPGWSSYLEWANKPAQRAALEAIAKVTEKTAYQTRMIFGLPFGAELAPPELVMNGMYIELGDPPTLAAAKFEYMDRVGDAMDLVKVEANRLLAEGKPADAIKVLTNGLFFARQLADRPSQVEKRFGMQQMAVMLEMIRDVTWRDSRSSSPKLTPDVLRDTIKAIGERDLLSIERIAFPEFERISGEQLASKVFLANGKINPQTFASTMSRVAAGTRPLRLFSEAGYWERVASKHKGAGDTKKTIENVASDLVKRWNLDTFDPYLSRPTDLSRTVAGQMGFSSVGPIMAPLPSLFDLRQRLRAEAAGTRMSLGVQAYVLRNKSLPPDFSAIRPAFVADIEPDPYLPLKKRLSFFVPIRDETGPGSTGEPHEVRVFQVPEYPNFSSKLGSDQFVVYSAGQDQTAEWAKDATQGNPEYKAGDMLLWPPRFSLLRQYLTEQGLLK